MGWHWHLCVDCSWLFVSEGYRARTGRGMRIEVRPPLAYGEHPPSPFVCTTTVLRPGGLRTYGEGYWGPKRRAVKGDRLMGAADGLTVCPLGVLMAPTMPGLIRVPFQVPPL